MGQYDDLIEMGELARQLGENGEPPPGMVPPAAAAEAPVVDPAPVVEPERHDYVGGMTEAPMPQEKTVDLDELLGLRPRQSDQAREQTRRPAPDPTAPKPGSVEERMAELAERARKAEADRDKLMQRLIDDRPMQQEPQYEPEEELLPETDDFIKPYIEKHSRPYQERIEALEKELAPMREEAMNKALASEIAAFVPGFTTDMMNTLHEQYDATDDPKLKAVYGSGVAGAVTLARDLVSRGALDLAKGKPRQSVSPLVSRHHTESGSPRSVQMNGADDEDSRVSALLNLPNSQFLKALEKWRND